MKVRAKQYGQYQGRMRETGEVFEIKNSELPHIPWVEQIPEPEEEPVVPAKKGFFQ